MSKEEKEFTEDELQEIGKEKREQEDKIRGNKGAFKARGYGKSLASRHDEGAIEAQKVYFEEE